MSRRRSRDRPLRLNATLERSAALPRAARALTLLALLGCLAACADRSGSVQAAQDLADALYPGQLELHAAELQKEHYAVVLAVKGDPVTRIRFDMDRDPAQCRVGAPCETRLRSAYAAGLAAGARLKALDRAFRACGLPLLAVEGRAPGQQRLIVELALGTENQQPALDRLAACVAEFKRDPGDALKQDEHLLFRVVLPGTEGAAPRPDPLTFEASLPSEREREPSYFVAAALAEERISQTALRLSPNYLRTSGQDERLVEAARSFLARQQPGAQIRSSAPLWDTRLDAQRLDLLRSYVLACSRPEAAGPCREDLAVRLSYDLGTAQAAEFELLPIVRQAGRPLDLPALPGR